MARTKFSSLAQVALVTFVIGGFPGDSEAAGDPGSSGSPQDHHGHPSSTAGSPGASDQAQPASHHAHHGDASESPPAPPKSHHPHPDASAPAAPGAHHAHPAHPADASEGPPESVTLALSPAEEAFINVKTFRLQPRSVREPVRFQARIRANENRIHPLVAGATGFITAAGKFVPGMEVPAQGLLGKFSSTELQGPVQAYLVTLDTIDKQGAVITPGTVSPEVAEQQKNYYAVNERLAADRLYTLGMSIAQVREIARTRRVPVEFEIRAPHRALLEIYNLYPGQRFDKGHEWARLVETDQVWAEVPVQATALWHFAAGAKVRIEIPGAERRLDGRVSTALPVPDEASGAMRVRIEINNRNLDLRPGMRVIGTLVSHSPKALLVPLDAVQMGEAGGTARVFVALGEGRFVLKRVRVGRLFGEWVEILEGLKAGVKLVREGAFLLDAEQRMKSQPAAHAHHHS